MTGLWFSLGTSVSSINKTDHHDITEILLKVTLNTINPNPSMNVARSFVFQILGDKYLAFDKQPGSRRHRRVHLTFFVT